MTDESIPLSAPDIGEAEIEVVVSVLRSNRLSLGPRLTAFENAIAQCVGSPHAVVVSSGTAGLHLALLALGIGTGDEVIVPSFTFIAVANAVRYIGAEPVFADIDEDSLNLDPVSVEARITGRTRALIVVHTFGRPAEMAALAEIARRHNLLLIEDACEAIGAEIDGRRVGSFGDAGVFAFYPNKQITTGEGGAVVTPHSTVARKIAALRNHGRYDTADWLQHAELGYNYRLSEMQCALGVAQMGRLGEILGLRAAVARRYQQHLTDSPLLRLPELAVPGQRLSWFVYIVRLAKRFSAADRDRIARELSEDGIATGRYFAPIHLQPAYTAWREKHPLPVTEQVAERTLALPFFNRLTDRQIERVCTRLRAALAR